MLNVLGKALPQKLCSFYVVPHSPVLVIELASPPGSGYGSLCIETLSDEDIILDTVPLVLDCS